MDPISKAIIAAVTTGVTETGKKAVLDAYQGLKGLIQSKLGRDNKVSKAVDELEQTPESKGRQMVLAENMALEKAGQDAELINIAQQLIQALEGTEQGRQAVAKYQIGVKGDHAHIEGGIHFGDIK